MQLPQDVKNQFETINMSYAYCVRRPTPVARYAIHDIRIL